MATYKVTLIGQLTYKPDLFDALALPEGYDRDLFIDALVMHFGDCPCLYTDPSYMARFMASWSRAHKDSLERLLGAFTATWNPIENYDRYETYTDKGTGSGTAKSNSAGDTEYLRSADDSSAYVQETKDRSENNDTTTSNSKSELTHDAHIHGNIGVTTATQMLRETVGFSEDYSLYDVAARMLATDLLLLVY